MNKLTERFGSKIKGVITGFDRIVFKGSQLTTALTVLLGSSVQQLMDLAS